MMTRKPRLFLPPLALALALHGAAFAAVAGQKVERIAPDRVALSWTDARPVDVYVADRPDAGLAAARLVARADRSGRLELPAAAGARPYFLLREAGDPAVTRVAERVLPLQQGSNFRDLGGYPGAGGKHVRWGRIFRSGGTPLLTDADVAAVDTLGLHDLIDLRTSEERGLAPTRINHVRYSAVGYSMNEMASTLPTGANMNRVGEAYRKFPTMLAPQLRILFATLEADEGPLAYNCSAGQDRTGFATALILSALGVPRDVIFADYHLSTIYRRPQWEMPKLDPAANPGNPAAAFFARYQQDPGAPTPKPLFDSSHKPILQYAFDEIEARWGSVDNYLDKELGVGPAQIAKLRAEYLE
jgi:protein-tyrosine phosphatase